MTKDTVFLAGLAGIAGNVFKEILSWSFYFFGLIKYSFVHLCAGLVITPAIYVKDPLSVIIGIIIDYTIAVIFSVPMYLVLKKTGDDYWFFKGLGFGMVVFLVCYGVLRPTFSLKMESTPLQALMYLIPNLVFGVITCWFLKKYNSKSWQRN